MRSSVGILSGNQIRPIRRKPGNFRRSALLRRIVRVKHGERCPAHRGYDSVELPPSQHMLRPALGVLQEGNAPLVAEHETVTRIEQRRSTFGGKIERILCQVILASYLD